MYRILLVDDEPIILSGIKFLIDWEKNNCTIIDSARNGQEALEKIHALSPDIVLCDINMPVMNGVELLKIAAAEKSETVFLMLTNLEDFALAREAMRLRAVDYLLKSQLEAETLERSLALACKECELRTKLARVDMVDDYLKVNRNQLLKDTFLHIVQTMPLETLDEAGTILEENNVLQSYGGIQIPLDFSALPQYANFTEQEAAQLFSWQREVVEKLVKNFFPHSIVLAPDTQKNTLLVFCWDIPPAQWEESLGTFATRLTSASANVTQAKPAVLATDLFAGAEDLIVCRKQLFRLRDYYYLSGCTKAYASSVPDVECRALALSGISGRFAAELRAKNAVGCNQLLEKAMQHVREIPHQQSQAAWLCGELYSTVCDVLASMFSSDDLDTVFFDRARGQREIACLATRNQVLEWLSALKNRLNIFWEQFSSGKSELIEKARIYVQANVDKRIMLQDVADHICISPGYLSALFKKQYNQNFVDYINATKMERACQLIQEDQHRIYEISYLLGFENAYYFTKVFKRHIGMTPTEYQHKLKGNSNNHVE